MMRHQELKDWYVAARPIYSALSEIVASTIEGILRHEGIDCLAITKRAKTAESLSEKVKRKRYSNPQAQITDLAGIRVITYVESDVIRAKDKIAEAFAVDEGDSGDKSEALGADRFGYRSVHLVCHVGKKREKLPEFAPYKNLRFEVQIRTALQHAWAEIEHDRSYKFTGELPAHLKRRFHLVAGLLELADREFDSLTSDIASYAIEVGEMTKKGDLDVEINSTSLDTYLEKWLEENDLDVKKSVVVKEVVDELHRFGLRTLADLEPLFSQDFVAVHRARKLQNTYVGLLRDVMMFSDIDRYFSEAFRRAWSGWEEDSLQMFIDKYGDEHMESILISNDLDVEPADT